MGDALTNSNNGTGSTGSADAGVDAGALGGEALQAAAETATRAAGVILEGGQAKVQSIALEEQVEITGIVCTAQRWNPDLEQCQDAPECGFCKFMKAGPCGKEFTAWEACIDQVRPLQSLFVSQPLTLSLCLSLLASPHTLSLCRCLSGVCHE